MTSGGQDSEGQTAIERHPQPPKTKEQKSSQINISKLDVPEDM
jgi:hypothetical protein